MMDTPLELVVQEEDIAKNQELGVDLPNIAIVNAFNIPSQYQLTTL